MSDCKLHLVLTRGFQSNNSTLGMISHKGDPLCYTLEDGFRAEKEPGATRIPPGAYKLRPRCWGGFHKRYMHKFTDFHCGMLEIADVRDFEHVLIHIGNTVDDTSGCILVGERAAIQMMGGSREFRINRSTQAYKEFYKFCLQETGGDLLGIELTIEDIS